jgi:hypothetical protein
MRSLYLSLFAVALVLTDHSPTEGGAKIGKIRWSSNPQIAKNRRPPIKVPAATRDGPGKVELQVVFKAKELAEFALIGDGDTDLDVIVKDAKGRVVAEDTDPITRSSDICICRWYPDSEQEYTIVIYNRGKVYNLCQAGCN